MIQIIEFVADWLSNLLFLCLVLWAIARVLEVWLNVYDRIKNGDGKE